MRYIELVAKVCNRMRDLWRRWYCCDWKSRSGMWAKLRTVAASNNRDHAPRSLNYCLFAPHICGVVLRAYSVRAESHIPNVNGKVATTPCREKISDKISEDVSRRRLVRNFWLFIMIANPTSVALWYKQTNYVILTRLKSSSWYAVKAWFINFWMRFSLIACKKNTLIVLYKQKWNMTTLFAFLHSNGYKL